MEGALARALNVPAPVGMLIQQVAAKSPSAEIGLRPGTVAATVEGRSMLLGGDVILAVQGVPLGDKSHAETEEALSRLPSGTIVRLTILREGQIVELSGAKP